MQATDIAQVLAMRQALWPDCSDADNQQEVALYAQGSSPELLGGALFVYELADGRLGGFCEVSLRSSAEGCYQHSPVGYIEGWFVLPQARGTGVGRALVAAGEQWARSRGCLEMGSDAELDNAASHRAHEAIGYEEVERVVCFRKSLV